MPARSFFSVLLHARCYWYLNLLCKCTVAHSSFLQELAVPCRGESRLSGTFDSSYSSSRVRGRRG